MHDNLTTAVSTNGQRSLKERVRELRLDDRLGNAKEKNSGSGTWLPWALCFILAVSWAGVGFRYYRADFSNKPTTPDAAATPAAIPAATASALPKQGETPTSGELVLEKKGYIIPAHQIPISPVDVAGRITQLNFNEGDICKEGFILAQIDPTSYKADLDEAAANVQATKSRYHEVEVGWKHEILQAESDLAEATAQMHENLLVLEANKATGSRAVAKIEIDQSQKKYDASVQRVESLKAKLELVKGASHERKIEALKHDLTAAEARLNRAQWRLDNCTLKAPVTGMILSKKAEFGSLINPVVGGVSTSLCEMADLLDLEVDLEIDERDLSKVFKGQECTVCCDAYPSHKYKAYISRIMPAGNRSKAIVPIRVTIKMPDGEEQGSCLKPEMNALVSFFAKKSDLYKEPNSKPLADRKDAAMIEKKGQP